MISKTTCQHCDQHIEFDVEAAGQFVACPNCGQQTRLIIPGASSTGVASAFPPKNKPKIPTKTWIVLAWVLVVSALVACAVKVSTQYPEALGQFGGGVVGIIAMVAIAVWAILWITFPVFVFFKMGEMLKVMRQIRDK